MRWLPVLLLSVFAACRLVPKKQVLPPEPAPLPTPPDVVPIHQSQAIWDNRSLPRVHAAFAELLGTEKLWVSMDRTAFVPPARGKFDREHSIHWDDKPRTRLDDPTIRVQGMLYLTDTAEEQGAFECVPSIFPDARAWLRANPGRDEPDVKGHTLVRVPGRAGDLVTTVGPLNERLAALLDRMEPALTKLQPTLDRLAETTDPREVDAMVELIDHLPTIAHKMETDILPILDSMGSVAPDLHDLLDVSRELNAMLSQIPGISRVMKRIDREQEAEGRG